MSLEQVATRPFVIHPQSVLRFRWDLVVVILSVYAAVKLPLDLVFVFESFWIDILDGLTAAVFLVDVAIRMHTAFLVRGKPVLDARLARRRYLASAGFVLDLVAVLPLQLVPRLFGITLPVTALRFLRLAPLAKILRLPQFLRAHQIRALSDTAFKLCTFLFWFLLTAHVVACGWLLLDGIPGEKFAGTERYLRSFYWCITTLATVGYGDITPQTPPQILYTVVVMILGITIYGYVIGNVTSLLANLNVAKSLHLKHLDRIHAFVRQHALPRELEERILSYQQYLWESRLGYDETEVVQQLPRDLRCDVLMHIHRDIIAKVPLFKGAPERLLREIVMELRLQVSTPGEFIFQKGDEAAEMYFIRQGSVQVLSGDGGIVYATLTEGSFFGEVALVLNQPRNASVRACDFCDLYVLPRSSFERVLARYPEFAQEIHALARERRGEQAASSPPSGRRPD